MDGKPTTDETPEHQQRAAAEQDERARQEQVKRRSQEAETAQLENPGLETRAREHADIQVRQAETMREQRRRLDAYEAEQKRHAEEAHQAEQKRQADIRGQQAEGEMRDAGNRYRIALGQNYDIMDPYRSLARAAMAEYAAFIQDREKLTQQIAREQDPDARRALDLRKEIEANDYMAITSQRIASQSEAITGRRDSEEAVRFRERAKEHEAQSKNLRQEMRDHAAKRAEHADVERAEQKQRDRDDQDRKSAPLTPTQSASWKTGEQETKGEITDAKAQRIAKIRERGRDLDAAEKVREGSPSKERGGRTR